MKIKYPQWIQDWQKDYDDNYHTYFWPTVIMLGVLVTLACITQCDVSVSIKSTSEVTK